MNRHPVGDGLKILLSLAAGPLAGFALLLLVVTLGVGFCGRTHQPSLQVAALRDTVRLTDSVEVVKWDTVRLYRPRADSAKQASTKADSAVTITSDSTAVVHDTVAVVPAEILSDLTANRHAVAVQDTLIRHLYAHDTTQQWRIAARDKFYAASLKQANGPRWGVGVTVGYGCGERGCGPQLTAGLTYQAKIPSPKALLRALFE